jgi:hypothetical protein
VGVVNSTYRSWFLSPAVKDHTVGPSDVPEVVVAVVRTVPGGPGGARTFSVTVADDAQVAENVTVLAVPALKVR